MPPPKLKQIRIVQINSKRHLSGIQLIFTENYSTPMFETRDSRNKGWEYKSISVDPSREIKKISLKVWN